MEVSKISAITPTSKALKASALEKTQVQLEKDSVSFSGKKMTDADFKHRDEAFHKAKVNAAGWSIPFGIFSLLYYGLRSDEKVAEKYDLDAKEDKMFINDIKKAQVISAIPGCTIVGGLIPWLYFMLGEDESNQKILKPKHQQKLG